eukprot:TRINITY_DN1575_c0_g1_i1.p1 TRINITY_DN1575_c0_g1~~TRINITY_DN1575_c0_g1_i1.p1  ORF type:complete len:505 (+),score=102.15 TRINITY_DN1575_c0_g1_i1:96-1517(+)
MQSHCDVTLLIDAFPQLGEQNAKAMLAKHGSLDAAAEALTRDPCGGYSPHRDQDFAAEEGRSMLCPRCFSDDVVVDNPTRLICHGCHKIFHPDDAKGGWARGPRPARKKPRQRAASTESPAPTPASPAGPPAAAAPASPPTPAPETPTAPPVGADPATRSLYQRLEQNRKERQDGPPRVRLCVRRAEGQPDRSTPVKIILVERKADVKEICKLARAKFNIRKKLMIVRLADGTELTSTASAELVPDGTDVFVSSSGAGLAQRDDPSSSGPSTPATPAADAADNHISPPTPPELGLGPTLEQVAAAVPSPPLAAAEPGPEAARAPLGERAPAADPAPAAEQWQAPAEPHREAHRRLRGAARELADLHRLDSAALRALHELAPADAEKLAAGLRGRRRGNLSALVTKRARELRQATSRAHHHTRHCDTAYPPSPKELKHGRPGSPSGDSGSSPGGTSSNDAGQPREDARQRQRAK